MSIPTIQEATFVVSFKADSAPTSEQGQQFAQEWFPAELLIYYNNRHHNFNAYRCLLNGSVEMVGDHGIPNVYTAMSDILTLIKGQAEYWGVHYDIDQVGAQSYDLLSTWRR